jgi:signal transduction histidine kinase
MDSSPVNPREAAARQAEADAERLRVAYRSAPEACGVNAVLGLLVLGVADGGRVSRAALFWYAAVLLAAAVRLTLWFRFRRSMPAPEESKVWSDRFAAGMLASALVWGAGAFVLSPGGAVVGQTVVTAAVIALAAGIAGTTLCNPAAIHIFLFVGVTPHALAFALQGTSFGFLVALMVMLFVVGTALRVRRNAQTLTELILLRLEVAAQRDAADRANVAKSRFLAAASHDLRQPLHAMTLLTDALADRLQTDEHRHTVGRLRESVASMGELFDALLDVSRLDAGIVVARPRGFRLSELLGRLEGDFALAAREKGLEWRCSSSDATVKSDPVLLEMLLRNLISNAVRYTEHGHVALSVVSGGEHARIEVTDTGIGIPQEKQREVFAEFHQLHNPERDGKKGLGLGLAIVDRLARLLEHQVDVRSRPGEGSCFSVTLRTAELEPEPAHEASREDVAIASDLSGMVVLVVDDQEAVRAGMLALLGGWGCETIVASGEREAVDAIRLASRPPELVIVDYRLRENRTGSDAVETVRRAVGAEIPALIITGDTAPERLKEARAGGHALMHKPVAPARLRTFLRTARRSQASA